MMGRPDTIEELLKKMEHLAATCHDEASRNQSTMLCNLVLARCAVEMVTQLKAQGVFLKGHVLPEMVKQTAAQETSAVAQAVQAHAAIAGLYGDGNALQEKHLRGAEELAQLMQIDGQDPPSKET